MGPWRDLIRPIGVELLRLGISLAGQLAREDEGSSSCSQARWDLALERSHLDFLNKTLGLCHRDLDLQRAWNWVEIALFGTLWLCVDCGLVVGFLEGEGLRIVGPDEPPR